MNKLKLVIAVCSLLLASQQVSAQTIIDEEKSNLVWDLGGREPRINVRFYSKGINIGGYEDVAPIIKNNFTNELYVKIVFTITDYCSESKTYTVTKTLKSYENYSPSPFFEGYSFQSKCKEFKSYGPKKSLRSRIWTISYDLQEIRDLTAEKKKKEEERLAAEKKAAEEKAAKEKEALARKQEAEKKRAEEKAAAEKKAAEEKAAKEKEAREKEAAAKKKEEEKKNSADKSTASKTDAKSSLAAEGSTGSSSSASRQSKAEQEAADREAKRIAREEAEAAERQREIERKQKEEQERREKQAAYDQWKAKKKDEQAAMETASMAASFGMLSIFGQWIYNENMGNVNPDYIYRTDRKNAQFNIGIEYGYSASVFPMIFKSNHSTMVNGDYVYKKSLEKVSAFTVNLDVKVKIGAEQEQFGGYAYLNPKVGFSPIFDAYNVSPFVFGAKAFGGLKWVKGYVDYSLGTRTFTKSSNDAEEAGEGRSSFKFNKLEMGLRFTTNPDDDYKRSHIGLGIIMEKLDQGEFEDQAGWAHPETNALMAGIKTPTIKGYAFEWKKDHHFKLFANFYPSYIYSGDVDHPGGQSSEFRAKTTGTFVEFGFVRSVDWFFNY